MNNDFSKLSRVIIAILVVAMLFLIGSCAPAPTTPSRIPEKTGLGELKELERDIIIEIEGEVLHYFEQKKMG